MWSGCGSQHRSLCSGGWPWPRPQSWTHRPLQKRQGTLGGGLQGCPWELFFLFFSEHSCLLVWCSGFYPFSDDYKKRRHGIQNLGLLFDFHLDTHWLISFGEGPPPDVLSLPSSPFPASVCAPPPSSSLRAPPGARFGQCRDQGLTVNGPALGV